MLVPGGISMSTAVVDEFIKRARSILTADEQKDLSRRLTEPELQPKVKPQPEVKKNGKDGKKGYVSPDTIWMRDHSGPYGGQYVALENGKLVSTGKGYPDTFANAIKDGAVRPLVTYVPREDEELFGGW